MSRHKIVRNLDLDDELDEYDGADAYDEEGDEALSEEDQEQMRLGTIAVREVLGPDVLDITDQEIREALWHYYYDVEKSTGYLLTSRLPKEQKKKKKKKNKGGPSTLLGFPYMRMTDATRWASGSLESEHNSRESRCTSLSVGDRHATVSRTPVPADFWDDMRWFHTSIERHSSLVPPSQPRGGLLGGASEGPPKVSKLQALAAARKKKALEQKSSSSVEAVDKPMAHLTITDSLGDSHRSTSMSGLTVDGHAPTTLPKETQRTYTPRKRKSSSPHKKQGQPTEPPQIIPSPPVKDQPPAPHIAKADPSAFANTIFGSDASPAPQKHLGSLFTLPYSIHPFVHSTDAFAGPSPDDVVIAAQSKAANAKSSKPPPKTTAEKKAEQIANGVEAMKIDDTPRAKSRNLDVLAEYEKTKRKNAANFVVIGHVDAGKSTLMGRLLCDLNVVDKRTIEKYRKEAEKMGKSSFALAWVLDQGSEERARGVTIDIATNKFETERTAFTILDAPGHRDFIPNMIAGASQADFAVLVIDANIGSFESGLRGQTKEHALLVRSMGVQRLIIAINKLDTVSWSQDRFDEISQQVSAFLLVAGFHSKNISFIPVSGLHGDNIVSRSTSPDASWYTGRTLVEELDASHPVAKALDKPFRFTIGDIFRGGVQNPLSVSGRVEAGSLQMGDALLAQPAGEKCFVKSLEIDNEAAHWAVAGQNVTIHLSDIDPVHLKIGDVLCSPSSPMTCVSEFTAKVLAFEFMVPGAVDVHRGRLHVAGKVSECIASLDKSTGAVIKKKPRVIKPGEIARVKVQLGAAVPLEKGLRVVLRSAGDTVAAGLLE
ncbi:MAG: Hsp70 suppressor, GTPase facilitates ribosomal subunit dissociation [Claussenomyces sp. TS43310]|nr:MAG: Hsp70 suppressor, GTPase facilitates ribosomal subunit dissociation [Claussenomyces sp. TS43310]